MKELWLFGNIYFIFINGYVYECLCKCLCNNVYVHEYLYECKCDNVCVWIYMWMYMLYGVYVWMSMWMYVIIYMCVSVYVIMYACEWSSVLSSDVCWCQRCKIPWSWSCRKLWVVLCQCLELNVSPQ